MGKSNKFDYTNRSNSGPKLGQIIGAALKKDFDKAKKDAEKSLQKTRKQSGDSAILAAETSASKHVIDLKAPNKELTDEGVYALADGLEDTLRSGDAAASLALEDLNLSGNGITTKSLARLAPIIEISRYDLKTINLASNQIVVGTDEQARQWEAFLKSFRGCLKLRRLDLSDNQQLGSRALEIFARVHCNEPPVHPTSSDGETSVLSLVEEADEDSTKSTASSSASARRSDISERSDQMTAAQVIKYRRGLRSIPYVTLNDVGLDDAGALWLSYVLVDHHYPTQLINDINAPNADTAIKAYQQDTESHGIDSNYTSTLGKEGRHLLEKSEVLRRQVMLAETATIASTAPSDDLEAPRRSTDRRHSRAAAGDRRVSIRSIRTDDGGEHEATEMESLQRKIQRHIIEQSGPHGVELWHAALTVFRTSRMLLFIAPPCRRYYTSPPTFRVPALEVPDTPTVQPPSPSDSPLSQSPRTQSIDTPKAVPREPSYAAKLSGITCQSSADVPESPLTEVTNTPVTPMLVQKHINRHGAFSEGTDLFGVTDKLNTLLVNAGKPDRYIYYQQRRIIDAEHSFRNAAMPCHLPFNLIQRIVSFATSGREMAVLSTKQMHAAINRGQNREALSAEREWLKRRESAQLWMLLDSMSCLAYGTG